MGKRRERLNEGKKNIIAQLIQEYDIHTAEDIQDALKDLLGGTIESMLTAELDNHLGYDLYNVPTVLTHETAENKRPYAVSMGKYQ